MITNYAMICDEINELLYHSQGIKYQENYLKDIEIYFKKILNVTPYKFFSYDDEKEHLIFSQFEPNNPICIHVLYHDPYQRCVAFLDFVPKGCTNYKELSILHGSISLVQI